MKSKEKEHEEYTYTCSECEDQISSTQKFDPKLADDKPEEFKKAPTCSCGGSYVPVVDYWVELKGLRAASSGATANRLDSKKINPYLPESVKKITRKLDTGRLPTLQQVRTLVRHFETIFIPAYLNNGKDACRFAKKLKNGKILKRVY